MTAPRLLFVHAHPDDETLTTGATIAHYAARGATVRVVTCTLGEEGEIVDSRWAQLASADADQLGGYRINELSSALRALGLGEPMFLGGAGRWRDSGMADAPSGHRRRFVDADRGEAVGALAGIIRELKPHVVVGYDPSGGYGHPDHVQVHHVTTEAVTAAAAPDADGRAWQVPKFYWSVTATSAIADGLEALAGVEVPATWHRVPAGALGFGFADDDIDAVVEAPEHHEAKVAAMRAHATQVRIAAGGRAFALSNDVLLPVLSSEHYVLAAGQPGDRDGRGWETDLLAGVTLQ